jgi:hypothetical protein
MNSPSTLSYIIWSRPPKCWCHPAETAGVAMEAPVRREWHAVLQVDTKLFRIRASGLARAALRRDGSAGMSAGSLGGGGSGGGRDVIPRIRQDTTAGGARRDMRQSTIREGRAAQGQHAAVPASEAQRSPVQDSGTLGPWSKRNAGSTYNRHHR